MEILFAYFGKEPNYFDVTSRIRQSLVDGKITGKKYRRAHLGDPTTSTEPNADPKELQTLTIFYSYKTKICKYEVIETGKYRHMKVDLPQ